MSTTPRLLVTGCALAVLAMGGCSSGDEPSTAEELVPHGHVDGAEEVEEAQLRLSVIDSGTGTMTIIDLLTGDELHERPGTPGTVLAAADSRYAYLADSEGDAFHIVDTGVWTVDHGDHRHHYRAEIAEIGELTGAGPAHVVPGSDATALFFDEEGSARIVDRTSLGEGKITVTAEIVPGPHHGVAVPEASGTLTTLPGDSPEELPGTLARVDGSGELAEIEPRCPEIHGVALSRDHSVVACQDGVIVDDGEEASLMAYPEDGDRLWSLSAGRDLVGGAIGSDAVALVDPAEGDWTISEIGAEVVQLVIADDDSLALALDAEGTVHLLDPESGEVTAAEQHIDQMPEIEGHGGGPALVLDRERAYVSDPAAGRVVEIDPRDGLRTARTFEIAGSPSDLAVTGR